METWVIATSLIFLYLVFTLVLGVVANRMMTVDMEDFLLYGRRAGFIVLYLTVVARIFLYAWCRFLGGWNMDAPGRCDHVRDRYSDLGAGKGFRLYHPCRHAG